MFAFSPFGKLHFHFVNNPGMRTLTEKLKYCRTDAPDSKSVPIFCYTFCAPLRHIKWSFYKGIPYKAEVINNEHGEIEKILFQAVLFRSFLFFRLILLPLLWRMAVLQGGFYLLGTAYRKENITYLLFANPGAGKTKYLLQNIEHDSSIEFIGDGSLLYLPTRGVSPVLTEIELRYKTVYDTSFWKYLSRKNQIRLFLYHWIAMFSRRYISFNITLPLDKLGLKIHSDILDSPHKIFKVLSESQTEMITAEQIESSVMKYLYQYHKHFKNVFNDIPPFDATIQNLKKFSEKYY